MITNKSILWRFVSNIFVSVDQLGNAIAGGNPDNTISARVGYYNHYYYPEGEVPWYWRWFQNIIDGTFYPVDGWNHCHEAYHNDAGEVFDNKATNIMIALAAIIIIISCIFIATVLYLLWLFQIVRPKTIVRSHNLQKRFIKSTNALKSVNQEISEHGLDFDLTGVRIQFTELKKQFHVIDKAINLKKND